MTAPSDPTGVAGERAVEQAVCDLVRLAETFGFALPWANLTAACSFHDEAIRNAVTDLIQQGILEATARGLRFALQAPPTMQENER